MCGSGIEGRASNRVRERVEEGVSASASQAGRAVLRIVYIIYRNESTVSRLSMHYLSYPYPSFEFIIIYRGSEIYLRYYTTRAHAGLERNYR